MCSALARKNKRVLTGYVSERKVSTFREETPRVARAQKSIRLHPLLCLSDYAGLGEQEGCLARLETVCETQRTRASFTRGSGCLEDGWSSESVRIIYCGERSASICVVLGPRKPSTYSSEYASDFSSLRPRICQHLICLITKDDSGSLLTPPMIRHLPGFRQPLLVTAISFISTLQLGRARSSRFFQTFGLCQDRQLLWNDHCHSRRA